MGSQNSDSAQKGPGLSPPSVPKQESAPNPGTGSNGQSQGDTRGKDGKST